MQSNIIAFQSEIFNNCSHAKLLIALKFINQEFEPEQTEITIDDLKELTARELT